MPRTRFPYPRYGPLGAEALITDAGWFEGGWPAGAGMEAPQSGLSEGMGPVAKAAKSNGMVYGLWFEFERVADGTWLAKNHPAWLLKSTSQPEGTSFWTSVFRRQGSI